MTRTEEAASPPPVLWVTPTFSGAARSGGEIRTSRMITALSERTSVTVAVVGTPPARATLPPVWDGVAFVGLARRSRLVATLVALLRRQPRAMAACGGRAVRELVERADEGSVVVLDHLALGGHAWRTRARTYLNLHNLDSEIYAPTGGARTARATLARLDARFARRVESRLARRADAVAVLVSERDAEALGGTAERWVVPNGADVPEVLPAEERAGFLFVGALDYEANLRGLDWFVREVLPAIPPHLGSLSVIGRGGPSAAPSLSGHPRVQLLGEVADAAAAVRRARLTVVPLLSGGGTRLKVLESAANATPFVATRAAVAGLPDAVRGGGIVTDDAHRFAEEVSELLTDDQRARELGQRGREAVRDFDWRVITQAFCDRLLGPAS